MSAVTISGFPTCCGLYLLYNIQSGTVDGVISHVNKMIGKNYPICFTDNDFPRLGTRTLGGPSLAQELRKLGYRVDETVLCKEVLSQSQKDAWQNAKFLEGEKQPTHYRLYLYTWWYTTPSSPHGRGVQGAKPSIIYNKEKGTYELDGKEIEKTQNNNPLPRPTSRKRIANRIRGLRQLRRLAGPNPSRL